MLSIRILATISDVDALLCNSLYSRRLDRTYDVRVVPLAAGRPFSIAATRSCRSAHSQREI
jgi:hypothetical protein